MRIIVTLLLTLLFLGCGNINKSTKMKTTEKFDFEYYQKKINEYDTTTDKIGSYAAYNENGVSTQVFINRSENSVYTIKHLSFKTDIKDYYKSGGLKEEWTAMFMSNVRIGLTKKYNEQGYLIEEIDEDKQFEKLKIKPNDILKYIEKQGYINLQTGEGEEVFENSKGCIMLICGSKRSGLFSRREPTIWKIEFYNMPGAMVHTINAETGEEISKTQEFYEE